MGEEGEQRCHGGCNTGRPSYDKVARAWDAVARPQAQCQTSHHFINSPIPQRNLQRKGLRLEATGLTEFLFELDDDTRNEYREVATRWELTRSSLFNSSPIVSLFGFTMPIKNYVYPATPVFDDINTIIAYVGITVSDNIYLKSYDIEGTELSKHLIGNRAIEDDENGNALVGLVFTIGAQAVKGLATAAIARAPSLFTQGAIAVAKGISAEAHRITLLLFRSMRARAIVEKLKQAGKEIIVNIGGEAAPAEIAQLGEHIALNHQVRMGAGRRYVRNLVKEPGENIGEVFKPDTVDKVVSNKLDISIDPDRLAKGAYKALRPGGKLDMNFFPGPGNAEFAKKFTDALTKAGFKNVQNQINVRFIAVK